MNYPYDINNPASIELYGKRLEGHRLRDFVTPDNIQNKNKGRFGAYVEAYFGIPSNSQKEADFATIGGAEVELKTSPLKYLQNGELRVKERLVFNIINYEEIYKEQWASSSFLNKNKLILWVSYIYDSNLAPCDYLVYKVRLISLLHLPASDLAMMQQDWQKIVFYIQQGLAHELSEGLTNYLGACTKGSTAEDSYRPQPFNAAMPAKQRAFSWKQSYLNSVLKRILGDNSNSQSLFACYQQAAISFEQYVLQRFHAHIGRSQQELADMYGLTISPRAKNYVASLSKKILGIHDNQQEIEEFQNAGIIVKTIRLEPSGKIKESMSFPAFKYTEIIQETWDNSELRNLFSQKFLFVIFQYNNNKTELYLQNALFWTMPEYILDNDVFQVWQKTRDLINMGIYDSFPKISDSRVCHVRPHAKDNSDVYLTPDGHYVPKKSFWLNNTFIESVIGIR